VNSWLWDGMEGAGAPSGVVFVAVVVGRLCACRVISFGVSFGGLVRMQGAQTIHGRRIGRTVVRFRTGSAMAMAQLKRILPLSACGRGLGEGGCVSSGPLPTLEPPLAQAGEGIRA